MLANMGKIDEKSDDKPVEVNILILNTFKR